jgi:hypothetical protein
MTSIPFNLDPNATKDPADPNNTPEGTEDLDLDVDRERGDESSEDVESTIISADSISHATEGSADR